MNSTPPLYSNTINVKLVKNSSIIEKNSTTIQNSSSNPEPLNRGQRLADKLANQVGSWKFLICQSTVLAGWVGMNLMPGVPHWDESPFIMLNLVFSFASAYTAPIVLMSQNRQSDTDRRNADIDHQVNLKASQNIELLHQKLDELHFQRLNELTQIVKEQQQVINELKLALVPQPQDKKDFQVSVLPGLQLQANSQYFPEKNRNQCFTVVVNHKKLENPIHSQQNSPETEY
ncbi:DUF1003 domain-containing protein [Planktothrix sp. FACHB-1365]|uniref:DUF1003 domain-containing protein n=1 Tax=Planktothrix sp. FACHB-1365 TaxID=2692855 RepID=UPI0016845370|nr:DUF1003 domain-containing protein [Planktothrix sp. FACHB-1365]MBD2484554.1 DUF1003 domain-containing protein [Planktothrix sp. FACHB-1365]